MLKTLSGDDTATHYSLRLVRAMVLGHKKISDQRCRVTNFPFICAHSRQRRFSRRSGIGRKLATHKNEVCLLPKQLGEQAAKLQVRAF